MERVDLAGAWNDMYAAVSSVPGMTVLLRLANVAAVVLGVIWLFVVLQGKRGKGSLSGFTGGHGGGFGLSIPQYTTWTLFLVIVLAAPSTLGSIVLPLVDAVANEAVGFFDS